MTEEARNGTLTVIVPAFNEEENIEKAAWRILETADSASIPVRVLFIDDGSSDRTWDRIRKVSSEDSRVTGLHFSRNFGKESAIFAGLVNARTECAAVMDADLQHPPEKLPEMYRMWQRGTDIVEGVKRTRGKETAARRSAAGIFYRLIGGAAGADMQASSDFKLLDREAVTVLKHMPERSTFFRAMSFWVGFRTGKVEYDVEERASGESKWSGRALIRYAFNNIASFSTAPMQIVLYLGGAMLLLGLVLGIIAVVQKVRGIALGGFTTVILLQILIGGAVMISLGIIGFYIARIYKEVQHRPRFIISETAGTDEGDAVMTG